MKILFFMLVVICQIGFPVVCRSQDSGYYTDYVMPTPEVSSFMKYGGQRPNLYTGTVNTSIPIYVYKDNDFEIPISLNYASNGYIPNRQASSVGLGWYLNATGYITRDVQGTRDEESSGTHAYGYHEWFKNYPFLVQEEQTSLHYLEFFYKPEFGVYYKYPEYIGTETTPDIFSFNFLGHTGKFSMGFNQHVHTYNTNSPAGEFSVDLSDFVGEYEWQNNSTIRIKTGDGYKYTFARPGDMGQYMLYFYAYPNYRYQETPRVYWPLTEIEAPNGRKVTFEYGNVEYSDNTQLFSTKYVDEEFFRLLRTTRESVCQLKSIKIDNVTIQFNYGARVPEKVFVRQRVDPDLAPSQLFFTPSSLASTQKLESVVVQNGTNVLKTCELSYVYATGYDNPVMFLQQVHVSGAGTYKMDYYDQRHSFPAHGTSEVDHWGYFNNRSDEFEGNLPTEYGILRMRPKVSVNEKNQETVLSTTRDPYFRGARRGMLKKIEYPTGGWTNYYYESHRYARKLTRDLTNNNLPYLLPYATPQEAGGLRIRRITDYKDARDSTWRDYDYSYHNSGACSGILLHFPRYKYDNQYRYANLETYSLDKTHIEYAEVSERFSDGSANVFHFTNYQEYPDLKFNAGFVFDHDKNISSGVGTDDNFKAEYDSRAGFRGKLLWTECYDCYGQIVSREQDYYNTNESLVCHLVAKLAAYYFYFHKMFVSDYHIDYTTKTMYTPTGQVTARTEYAYNFLGQVIKTSSGFSNGKIYNTRVHHAVDLNHNESTVPEDMLISYNMHSYPVKEWKTVQDFDPVEQTRGPEKITESKKYTYKFMLDAGIYEPGQFLKLLSTKTGIITAPMAVEPEYKYETIFSEYDKAGRPLEVIDYNNVMRTCYIWGYGGLYPVAKISNCTLQNLIEHTGLTSIREKPLTGALSADQEEKLRAIPDAEVTTYMYQPFVGLSKVTDANKRVISYEYDAVKRLIRVKKNGETISEYQYSPNTL